MPAEDNKYDSADRQFEVLALVDDAPCIVVPNLNIVVCTEEDATATTSNTAICENSCDLEPNHSGAAFPHDMCVVSKQNSTAIVHDEVHFQSESEDDVLLSCLFDDGTSLFGDGEIKTIVTHITKQINDTYACEARADSRSEFVHVCSDMLYNRCALNLHVLFGDDSNDETSSSCEVTTMKDGGDDGVQCKTARNVQLSDSKHWEVIGRPPDSDCNKLEKCVTNSSSGVGCTVAQIRLDSGNGKYAMQRDGCFEWWCFGRPPDRYAAIASDDMRCLVDWWEVKGRPPEIQMF